MHAAATAAGNRVQPEAAKRHSRISICRLPNFITRKIIFPLSFFAGLAGSLPGMGGSIVLYVLVPTASSYDMLLLLPRNSSLNEIGFHIIQLVTFLLPRSLGSFVKNIAGVAGCSR